MAREVNVQIQARIDSKLEALTEHYQKTYELTYALWQQRNRTFLLLLAVVAAVTLLTFSPPHTQASVLAQLLGALIGIEEDAKVSQLKQGLPFALLQSILLMIVFYLMVNLYHRAVYVLRNYGYLSLMEAEIRQELVLANSTAFTRESTFYWNERAPLAGVVKWIYIAILGLLLAGFLGGGIVEDWRSGELLLAITDTIVAIPTAIFYTAYARASVGLDTKAVIVGEEN